MQAGAVVDDLHGAAAEHVAGADHHRIADAIGDGLGFLGGARDAVVRLAQPQAVQQKLEAFAVLGDVDRVGRCAEDRDVLPRQRLRQFQRRLAAVLHDAAEQRAAAFLAADQRDDVLRGQRLEIQPVGGVVVGADGFRIAVDHDGLEAGILQRIGGVDAAIVELDALADAVRPAAEDDDLLALGGIGLARPACRSRLRRWNTCRAWREANSAAQVSIRL